MKLKFLLSPTKFDIEFCCMSSMDRSMLWEIDRRVRSTSDLVLNYSLPPPPPSPQLALTIIVLINVDGIEKQRLQVDCWSFR
jgi:hypothetical protein